MSRFTQSLWKKVTASTVIQAGRLCRKARARRILVLGENSEAFSESLASSAEHLETLPQQKLLAILSRSADMLRDGAPLFDFKDNSFDMCVVSFALHQQDPEAAEMLVRECQRIAHNSLLIDFALAERNIELPSQFFCSLVEQFLHRGHWDTYKHYVRVGALHGIAHRAEVSEFSDVTIWGGGIRLLLVG